MVAGGGERGNSEIGGAMDRRGEDFL